jgi:UDP-4-amino-4,6-dideoxy-N-acetyl-beta-L-altrosamine N-acetyltransferase
MLRPATDADRADVLRWRNHPEVRAASLSQQEITEAEHETYWAATRDGDAREIYIYERYGEPSGVVTYFNIDREAATAWWGYYLDNDGLRQRGEMLPAWMEIQREAKRLAFDELGLTTLEGEVLEVNEAVRRFNRRNGFKEVERYTHDIDGTPTPVLRVRATKG